MAFIDTVPRESALYRAVHGEDAEWGLSDDLLALVADRLGIIHYALTAKRGDPLPVFVSRGANTRSSVELAEGESVDLNDNDASGTVTGEVASTAEIARQLGWA